MALNPGKDEILFVPLGGAGEIGMNLNVYGHDGKWLIVDCGVTFGDPSLPGVDVMMADPTFVAERRRDLVGMVITHAHEDHVGAVAHLWPRLQCPVYATRFTLAVLRNKLEEVGLGGEVPLHEIPISGSVSLKPFDIELVTMTHSIPEPNGVILRTGAGTVYHTADWKLDPDPLVGPGVDEDRLQALGEEGVLAMVGDSTNVTVEGHSRSEGEARASLMELVGTLDNRVVVACFASNVARVQTLAEVAHEHGRAVGLVGRSLWRIVDIARECGYLGDIEPFLPESEVGYVPPEKILMAVTGSQGEPRSALARIASGTHPNVVLEEGDTVIFSSREIPGNEVAIGKVQNQLARMGVEVITDDDVFVHVSGHPARGELMQMYQWIRPQILVPVHGEMRHLQEQARLARDCQIPHTAIAENGTMLRFTQSGAEVVDHVHAGRLALDGTRLVPIDGAVIRERNRIRHSGMAVATVVLDRKGKLLGEPQLTVQGVLDEAEEGETWDDTVDAIVEALNDLTPSERRDDESVSEAARVAVRRSLKESIGKRPVTNIHVVRV